jgi:signal transduction histidine kinase/CheY-like chemotaxis protein
LSGRSWKLLRLHNVLKRADYNALYGAENVSVKGGFLIKWHSFFSGIYARMVVTTLIPLLAFTSLIGYYVVSSQSRDIEDFQYLMGELAVEQLINNVGQALIDYDLVELNKEANYLFNISGVDGIFLHNTVMEKTLALGSVNLQNLPPISKFESGSPWIDAGHQYFFRDVRRPRDATILSSPQDRIGWVIVAIDKQFLVGREEKKVINTILVIIFSFFVAVWLSIRFTRSISMPIERLNTMVNKMTAGKLDDLAEEEGPDEVRLLSSGINMLAVTIRQANSQMEREITRATAQLHATLVELEEVTEAQNQFLARMSHELRTPLTAVIGFSRLAATENDLDKRHDYLGVVDVSSTMLLTMIDDILEFSKGHSAGFRLEKINFDLKKWFDDVVAIHQQSALDKNLSLHLDVIGGLPSLVCGDPVRLAQVVSNLLGNAIKFTDEGSIWIHLEVDTSRPNGSVLHCSVKDSGKGIAEDKKVCLFEVFSQEDESINRRYGGAGLGLSICKRLVNLMDGEIDVESTLGQGSDISFTCRLFEATESAFSDSDNRTSMPIDEVLRGSSILVAEDNHFSQRLIVKLLKSYGADCLIANNGLEATEIARLLHVDLVLMDVHMPVIDGVSACDAIVNQSSASPPVIGLTADIIGDGEAKMLEAGAELVLQKPFNETHLINSILAILKNRETILQSSGDGILSSLIPVAELKQTLQKYLDELESQLCQLSNGNLQQGLHDLLGLSGLYGMTQFREMVLSFKASCGSLSTEQNLEQINVIRQHVDETLTSDQVTG